MSRNDNEPWKYTPCYPDKPGSQMGQSAWFERVVQDIGSEGTSLPMLKGQQTQLNSIRVYSTLCSYIQKIL
jgi:hypothetical protein